jgi:hypothetical protein
LQIGINPKPECNSLIRMQNHWMINAFVLRQCYWKTSRTSPKLLRQIEIQKNHQKKLSCQFSNLIFHVSLLSSFSFWIDMKICEAFCTCLSEFIGINKTWQRENEWRTANGADKKICRLSRSSSQCRILLMNINKGRKKNFLAFAYETKQVCSIADHGDCSWCVRCRNQPQTYLNASSSTSN